MRREKEQELLDLAREQLAWAIEDDRVNRQMALEDLEFAFVEGKQWPEKIAQERAIQDRPCLTINKMPVFIDQVVGDQRMNRPAVKVVPVDNKADLKIATILGGWIKHVSEISKADVAIDHGFEHAAACGYGALRVVTEYASDDTFDQDARIRKIDNALSVYWGPHTEYTCADAPYCFIIADVPRKGFKEKYGFEPMAFNLTDSQYVEGWCTKDTVRIAEWFVKEPIKKKLYLLQDGRTVDELPEGVEPVKTRIKESFEIKWYKLTGNKIFEESVWPGKKFIPVIPIWGKEINVGGKRYIRGMIRMAKDAQRLYNFWQSSDTELIALAPKSPYIITVGQIKGHEQQWNNAYKTNYPYLLVNPDPKAPGWPKREPPPQASTAMAEKIRLADQEIRDTIGLQKAALGMQSNERSGRAIQERKKEGDTGTFAYIDNLARSIEHLGRVLVDIAPGILDTERIIRLGLEDGTFKQEGINAEIEDGKVLNDLSVGSYDVAVTVGPSFTTQRTEARQSMSEFIQYYPQAAPLIADKYAKLNDWPGAEELAERLVYLLPPELKAKALIEAARQKGEEPPPPTPPGPPPPSPEEQLKVEQEKVKLAEAQVRLEEEKLKLEEQKLNLEKLRLELHLKGKAGKAEIEKHVEDIMKEMETANASQGQEE